MTPPKDIPSLIITNCNNSHRYYQRKAFSSNPDATEGPVKFDFTEDSQESCLQFDDSPKQCAYQQCFVSTFTLKDKDYSELDVQKLCLHISNRTLLSVEFKDKRMSFKIGDRWINKYGYKRCYVMMHETFAKSFKFDRTLVSSYYASSRGQDYSALIRKMLVGAITQRIAYVRSTVYQNEPFEVFYLDNTPDVTDPVLTAKYGTAMITEYGTDVSLISNNIDLSKPAFPKTIKIVCENIEPQIYNTEYSKNVLVYTPDFNTLKSYTTQEIQSVDYMPLLNTLLTDIRFKLLDEDNQQIQLLPGAATWIKMSLRMKPAEKKSFNAVLTSGVSDYYSNNTQSAFRVKLPSPLNLDRQWKVCVSSLSHPTLFSTFLSAENEGEKDRFIAERSFGFVKKGEGQEETEVYTVLNENQTYDEYTLVKQLNNFLSKEGIGNMSIVNNYVNLQTSITGKFIMGESLAHVLGHKGPLFLYNDMQVATIDAPTATTIVFQSKVNLEYLHPKYIMVYTNVIQPIPVAGEYRKLLRISPIERQEVSYITNYFRHKEFTGLESTYIDSVEIILASHDGRKICFGSTQDVVINLEFSNHSSD